MRESPVASPKIAVDHASRRPRAAGCSSTRASIGTGAAATGARCYHRCARPAGSFTLCRTSSSRRSGSGSPPKSGSRTCATSRRSRPTRAACAPPWRTATRRRSRKSTARSSAGSTRLRRRALSTATRRRGRSRRRRSSPPARRIPPRKAWQHPARRLGAGAMVVPRRGRREPSYLERTRATEDAASGRAARAGGTAGVSSSLLLGGRLRGGAAGDLDECPGEHELARELTAALESPVELREPHDRGAELLGTEVPRLFVQLPYVELVSLHALGCGSRRDALRIECLAFADPRDVVGQETGGPEEDVARSIARAFDEPLARSQHGRNVTPTPGVGEVERWDFGSCGHQVGDLAFRDLLAGGPGRELVDLGQELLGVVAHELDERAGGLAVDLDASLLELLLDPFREVGLAATTLRREVVDEHLACLRHGLRQCGGPLDLLADEGQDRRRGRSFQILGYRLHVRRFPALDAVHYDEPPLDREKTKRVGRRRDILAGCFVGAQMLGRGLTDAVAEAS